MHGWDERAGIAPDSWMMTGSVGGIGWRCVIDSHRIEPFVRRRIRQFCEVESSGSEVRSIMASHV